MSYIPNTDAQRHEMLKAAGVQSFDEVFERAVRRK